MTLGQMLAFSASLTSSSVRTGLCNEGTDGAIVIKPTRPVCLRVDPTTKRLCFISVLLGLQVRPLACPSTEHMLALSHILALSDASFPLSSCQMVFNTNTNTCF